MGKIFYIMSKETSTKPREWAVCQCGLLMLQAEKQHSWSDEDGNPIGTAFTRLYAESAVRQLRQSNANASFCICHISNGKIAIDIEI